MGLTVCGTASLLGADDTKESVGASAGVVGACLGRWDMPGSPRHDHIPLNMPAGVHGPEGLAGGCGGQEVGVLGVFQSC